MKKSSGFTAIEILIVIAMTAVVTAIAVPVFQNLVRSHAGEDLISELNMARMKAIQLQRTVTLTITPPAVAGETVNRCITSWIDNNGNVRTRTFVFENIGEGYVFDLAPPGGALTPVPDNQLFFSSLGFISSTGVGNTVGNIYLINRDQSRSFQIQTNIAGHIVMNRWSAVNNAWEAEY